MIDIYRPIGNLKHHINPANRLVSISHLHHSNKSTSLYKFLVGISYTRIYTDNGKPSVTERLYTRHVFPHNSRFPAGMPIRIVVPAYWDVHTLLFSLNANIGRPALWMCIWLPQRNPKLNSKGENMSEWKTTKTPRALYVGVRSLFDELHRYAMRISVWEWDINIYI